MKQIVPADEIMVYSLTQDGVQKDSKTFLLTVLIQKKSTKISKNPF